MAAGRRPYLVPDGEELDCAHFLSESEYVGGLLRLPRPSHTGRMCFLEEVPDLAAAEERPTLDPVPVTLTDGRGGGTEGCLLDSFVSSTHFSAPIAPRFPLTLTVNRVLVGSSDPGRTYGSARLVCPELVEFFGGPAPTPGRAERLGTEGLQRAAGEGGAIALELREGVEVADRGGSEVVLRWYGEIALSGPPRPIEEWAEALVERLCLFAFLCDRPLRPGQVSAEGNAGRVDFYASWPEAAAPTQKLPLALLPQIEERLGTIVAGWEALLEGSHDLLDHLSEFQLFRERGTTIDAVLSLSRCLELYFDFCPRFESKHRPSGEHRVIVEEVIAALPGPLRDEHEEWIRGSLRNSNRRTLGDQLAAILADLGPELLVACGIDDADAFVRRARAARNHLTHPVGPPGEEVPEGRDLVIHIDRLWFLVRACVLREMGFDDKEIAACLRRSGRRYLLR